MLIHDLVLESARVHPQEAAIEFAGRRLTYQRLAELIDQVAGGLLQKVASGSRVALNLHKSPEAIILMLACLRAGCPYVPVDPATPLARRAYILRDSEAKLLVVDGATGREWDTANTAGVGSVPRRVRRVTFAGLAAAKHARVSRWAVRAPDEIAYILYTSGSTGDPKGVVITHGNAAAFVDWAAGFAEVGPGDRVAVHAPLSFDLPVFDIYVGLAGGATVLPIDETTVLFPQALLRFLQKERVSVLYAVPSALVALLHRSSLGLEGIPSLRLLLYAGEVFHREPLRKLMAALPGTTVFNFYGPIETNVVTAQRIRDEHLDLPHVPIGKPVSGSRIVLVDEAGRVIREPDQAGEILVSGPSVSPGYVNRPDLTAASRLRVSEDGCEWDGYRTGDFATQDREGTLHFLGRRDGLVKTRGFRVELGDVEAAMLRHPKVLEAAVIAKPDPEHTNLLFGFAVVEANSGVDGVDVVGWCRQVLPPYMVPVEVSIEADFPRTGTGKIARRELADRGLTQGTSVFTNAARCRP